jgi:hypothetical protein
MRARRGYMLWTAAAGAVAAFALSPAIGAVAGLVSAPDAKPGVSLSELGRIGSFTPANPDPRLAESYAKAALQSNRSFRFTPASGSVSGTRSMTIAVRAIGRPMLTAGGLPAMAITPVAYNLGVARGWKKFALPDTVGKLELPPVAVETGTNSQSVDGFSLTGRKKFSTSVRLDSERPIATSPQTLAGEEAISVDVAGSYSLTRNLDLKAGVRYRGPMNRLAPLTDDRQDSQAVYIGTAFKF